MEQPLTMTVKLYLCIVCMYLSIYLFIGYRQHMANTMTNITPYSLILSLSNTVNKPYILLYSHILFYLL